MHPLWKTEEEELSAFMQCGELQADDAAAYWYLSPSISTRDAPNL